jgi:hypothetical protein
MIKVKRDLMEKTIVSEVEGTDSESCPLAGFDISDAEALGSIG